MVKNNNFRQRCGWCLVFLLILTCQVQPIKTLLTLPSHVNIIHGNTHYLPLAFPNILNVGFNDNGIVKVGTFLDNEINAQKKNGIVLEPVSTGSVKIQLKLLGIIPIQTLNINVLPELNLIPGGQAIGVYMQTDGILVTGFMKVEGNDGTYSPAEKAGISTGDYIIKVNGFEVSNLEKLEKVINQEAQQNSVLNLLVRKGNIEKNINVRALKSSIDNKYKIGIYGKTTTSGIGTLTYIDPNTRTFGALGHTVTDPDSRTILKFKNGGISLASITSIEKAKPGIPGQKNGVSVNRNDVIGSITKNGKYGVYGNIINESYLSEQLMAVALSDSINVGSAQILTVVNNTEIETFDIKIVKAPKNTGADSRGMVIEITDKELLEKTGGIVQGMSGSPIIQDNHIIGAVTHVFLNNPKRGYGCYIENMIYESELLELQFRHISTNIWRKRRAG